LKRTSMTNMYRWPLALVLAGAAFVAWSASSAPISYTDLLARPRPEATLARHYGPAPDQVAELFLPKREGPIRTIVLIHGGCWLAKIPGTVLMDYLAEDLRKRGFAVWNIDYRRIGENGGGYPGTFPGLSSSGTRRAGIWRSGRRRVRICRMTAFFMNPIRFRFQRSSVLPGSTTSRTIAITAHRHAAALRQSTRLSGRLPARARMSTPTRRHRVCCPSA